MNSTQLKTLSAYLTPRWFIKFHVLLHKVMIFAVQVLLYYVGE